MHIFDDDTVHNPGKLLDRVEAEGITIFEVVPSQLRLMLDDLNSREMNRPGFTNLRWLVLAGEVLPPRLCREWFGYYADVPLMNAYGPTECTDNVTHHAIYEAPPAEMVSVPIGRSVANLRLYVLDDQLQPTPIGVPGELYIGGVGVGRGYLNDPKRTAAAFMADPFATEPRNRGRVSTRLGTWHATSRMEPLSFWDASTTKSKYAGAASSWVKSKRFWLAIPKCVRVWSSFTNETMMITSWWRTWCRGVAPPSRLANCVVT